MNLKKETKKINGKEIYCFDTIYIKVQMCTQYKH